jgi:hypothetical protein
VSRSRRQDRNVTCLDFEGAAAGSAEAQRRMPAGDPYHLMNLGVMNDAVVGETKDARLALSQYGIDLTSRRASPAGDLLHVLLDGFDQRHGSVLSSPVPNALF